MPKGNRAELTATDVLVTIDARAEFAFAVVEMNGFEAVQAQQLVKLAPTRGAPGEREHTGTPTWRGAGARGALSRYIFSRSPGGGKRRFKQKQSRESGVSDLPPPHSPRKRRLLNAINLFCPPLAVIF